MCPQTEGKRRGRQELMAPSVLSSAHPAKGASIWCLRMRRPREVHDWPLATPSWGLQDLWSSLPLAQPLRAGAELMPSRGVSSVPSLRGETALSLHRDVEKQLIRMMKDASFYEF